MIVTWPYYSENRTHSVLKELIDARGWRVPKKTPCTHTMYNGGCLNIPFEEYVDEFLPRLIDDHANGCFWSLSEKVNPACFPMYLDLDADENITDEIMDMFFAKYHELLFQFFPSLQQEEIETVVCIKRGQTSANGVHIINPTLIVNQDRASTIVDHLRHVIIQQIPDVNWAKVIDTGVYRNGLRMCYNYQCKNCRNCEVLKRQLDADMVAYEAAVAEVEKLINKKRKVFTQRKVLVADNARLINELGIHDPHQLREFRLVPNPFGPGYMINESGQDRFWSAILAVRTRMIGPKPRREPCEECGNQQRIFKPAEYQPTCTLFAISANEMRVEPFTGSDLDGMLKTYLRRPDDTPLTSPFEPPVVAGLGKRKYGGSGARRVRARDGDDSTNPLVTVTDPRDKRLQAVQKMLRNTGIHEYKFIQVTKITLAILSKVQKANEKRLKRMKGNADKIVGNLLSYNFTVPDYHMKSLLSTELEVVNRIFVDVQGAGSHYCHNKRMEHGKSVIKFELTSNGECYQRCFSTKTPDNSVMACNEFRFLVAHVPPQTMSILFPTPPGHALLNGPIRRGTSVPMDSRSTRRRDATSKLSMVKQYFNHIIENKEARCDQRREGKEEDEDDLDMTGLIID